MTQNDQIGQITEPHTYYYETIIDVMFKSKKLCSDLEKVPNCDWHYWLCKQPTEKREIYYINLKFKQIEVQKPKNEYALCK